jgi:hypothetical protein
MRIGQIKGGPGSKGVQFKSRNVVRYRERQQRLMGLARDR